MRCALAVLALFAVGDALRTPPMARRQALLAAGALAPALVLPPLAAHADAIEEIAARNAAANKAAAEKKAKAAEDKALFEAAGSGLNLAITAVSVALVGGVGVFGAQALQQSSKTTSNNLDRNRLLTDSEKQRFKNLSAAEKKKRGINL